MIALEVFDGAAWIDFSDKLTSLRHKIASRQLEAVDFELVNADVRVGQRVRVKRGASIIFEGIIYERRRRQRHGVLEVEATAYSELIAYDRYIVYRMYSTRTTAGAIIRDLASLMSDVDVTNVDDGPALSSTWEIQNEDALQIMTSVARGTNYYLRMRPGRVLFFKPKDVSSAIYTITADKIIEAEYSEDRWRLKNRVIYIGANGRVLADVSEPPGDMPVVVHDPSLINQNEAVRRARIRLALNREFGRELRVVMHEKTFEASGIDLFSTVAVDLPSLGISENMFVVQIEYDPRQRIYTLMLGGRLELLEDYLSEALGGDTAARFGPRPSVVGEIADLRSTLFFTQKLLSASSYRYVTYWNRRPLTLHASQNVTLNPATGMVELAPGSTSGYAEIRFLPPTETFRRWNYVEWISYRESGQITVKVMDAGGNVLVQKDDPNYAGWHLTKRLHLKRWPRRAQEITRRPANRFWIGINAEVFASTGGIVSGSCIGMRPTGSGFGEIVYPLPQPADFSWARFATCFLYAFSPSTTVKLRLYNDPGNYYEGTVNVTDSGIWKEYVLSVPTFSTVGNPSLSNVARLGIASDGPLLFDVDYLLHQYHHGALIVRFEMSRASASNPSPKISSVIITYEEVTRK